MLELPVLCFGFKNVNLPAGTVDGLQKELFDGPWPTGTLSEYWEEVSYGVFRFDGTVYDAGNLDEDDTYYEGADNGFSADKIEEYVAGAVAGADATVDFSQYDNDGPDGVPNSGDDDGIVDLLALVHPEFGGENTGIPGNGNVWSHRWTYASASGGTTLSTDDDAAGGGKIRINDYTIMPALNSAGGLIEMGVFCHEFGHALGFPDLYDRDNSGEGMGHHCLMGAGNWNSPSHPAHVSVWCRVELGWVEPDLLLGDTEDYELRAIETERAALKIVHDPAGTEYFRIENRQPVGFDDQLKDCGLAIWHVDPGVGNSWNDNEWCTGGALHCRIALEQPDGRCDLENGVNRGDSGDFFNGDSGPVEFSSTSNPNALTYGGDDGGVKLSNFHDCQMTLGFDVYVNPIPQMKQGPWMCCSSSMHQAATTMTCPTCWPRCPRSLMTFRRSSQIPASALEVSATSA